MASQSGALPIKFGNSIALVFDEIMCSILVTSTLNVSGSTSMNTGTQPARTIGAISVEKVSGEVITSEPAGRSSNSIARYSADDPELHITPNGLPNKRAT